MSKIKQDKIPVDIQEYNWKIVRERDGLTKYAHNVVWVKWNEDDTFSGLKDKPELGLSCMLDPHPFDFTWITTSITDIVEQKEDYTKFNTENSVYELWKLS